MSTKIFAIVCALRFFPDIKMASSKIRKGGAKGKTILTDGKLINKPFWQSWEAFKIAAEEDDYKPLSNPNYHLSEKIDML